jgi:hypothetical protein
MSRLEQIREAAKKGGRKTARLYGKKFKEARATAGGQACLLRYGREYYVALRAMRTG